MFVSTAISDVYTRCCVSAEHEFPVDTHGSTLQGSVLRDAVTARIHTNNEVANNVWMEFIFCPG
jgi:hypothetical protein